VQEPKVNFSQVKMTGLTFDKVDLLFDIDINNPNSVGINLAGFDYDLFLNQNSFLKGDQQDGLEIKANGKETVKIPLSLDFKSIYQTFQSVKDLDSINYELKTGLSFNLPALGNIRIPVSKSGYIPSLKLPSIRIKSVLPVLISL
jgi:LEA14-like dessication related protein